MPSGRRQFPVLVACVALALWIDAADAAPRPCVANLDGVWSDQDQLDRIGACKVCSADGTRCEQCWEFFSFNAAGDCVPCAATKTGEGTTLTCISCKGDDPSFCYDCGGRFLLREEDEDVEGYYADASGKCIQCPTPDCSECRNITGACVQCRPGYGLVDGTCQQCKQGGFVEETEGDAVTVTPPLCPNCDGDVNVCRRCRDGFFYDPAAAECKQCMANCDRCESADDCSKCSFGSALEAATGKCVQCPFGCSSCTAPNQCSECQPGYTNVTTDGSACSPCADTGCSQCNEGTDRCTQCSEQGFGPDPSTKGCVPCTQQHCARCSGSSATCDECKAGFLLDGATKECVPCKVANCSSCELSNKTGQEECSSCLDGFASSVLNASPITACVAGAT